MAYFQWKPYVSVAQRRHQAKKRMDKLRKQGVDVQPVEIEGRKIATTFWGRAWCDHMDEQGDYSNRLPRGRSYVRNGSVCHLSIEQGKVTALVSGSEIYNVAITIGELPSAKWKQVRQQCGGQIGSLLELLEGRISSSVMEVVTDPSSGLFPAPKEIKLKCDCPDYATMCKHAAAVIYGVGARLDRKPELLFLLRGVNHLDLISASANEAVKQATRRGGNRRQLAAGELGDVFGIDLEAEEQPTPATTKKATRKKKTKKKPRKGVLSKSAKKKTTSGKPAKSKKTQPATKSAKSKPTKKTTKKAAAKRAAKKKQATKKSPVAAEIKKKISQTKKKRAAKKRTKSGKRR